MGLGVNLQAEGPGWQLCHLFGLGIYFVNIAFMAEICVPVVSV